MAKTSRPCSAANRAVMSAPLFSAASITTTARLKPLMMRLRAGNSVAIGSIRMHDSVTSAPDAATSLANSACSGG
jgi:hypothetical protein